MMTLEKAIAFNPSYREAWRHYFDDMTKGQLSEKLAMLTSGMDKESRVLCQMQADIVPHLFPHELLGKVFIPESFKRDLLPEKTYAALAKAGFFSDKQKSLDKLQRDLDLPEEPIPELLLHSGLKYLPKQAKKFIRGKAIIDGGAYIGDTAKLFCKYYEPSHVYAIEPELKAFETLSAVVHDSGLQDKIVPVRRILSGEVGQEILWGEGVGASIIEKRGSTNLKSERIESTTIDTIVKDFDIPAVGMIKLDVEGTELAAIEGALETIKRCKPLMLISIYHTAKDFFEIKPLIEGLGLGYKFMVRKVTDDLMKEIVLFAWPQGDGSNV